MLYTAVTVTDAPFALIQNCIHTYVCTMFSFPSCLQSELELVMMGGEEDSRKHFSLKAILDQEKPKRKGRRKKDKKEVRTVHAMKE